MQKRLLRKGSHRHVTTGPLHTQGGVPTLRLLLREAGLQGSARPRTSALMKPTSASLRSRVGDACRCSATSDGPPRPWAELSPPVFLFPEGRAGPQPRHTRWGPSSHEAKT